MGSFVTVRCHLFPFFERWIVERSGFLPPLHTFRPADLGSLIARFSDRIKNNSVKPAFLLGKAKYVVINPSFQEEGQRPALSRVRRQLFFASEKSRNMIVENLD